MTKASKLPVKVVNWYKYRNGLLKPGLSYTNQHKKCPGNWFFRIENGKCEYRDIGHESLITCGLEEKCRKNRQDKKKMMKELMEGKTDDNQVMNIACLSCQGQIGK